MATRRLKPLTPGDLYRFRLITSYDLSPDGTHVVYALQRVDRKTEKRHSDLFLVPTDSGEPRRFTTGDYADTAPRWSPDGRLLAFLSNRDDEKQSQLYVMPVDGGEARRVTDLAGSLGEFAWSPDGSAVVIQYRPKDEEVVAREQDAQKNELGVVVRHITRAVHKWDGVGFLPKARWQLHRIELGSGKSARLTDGRDDELSPVFSPDGSTIAFVANRTPDPDLDQMNTSICLVPATGGKVIELALPAGGKSSPSFSPDGGRLAYFCSEGTRQFWRNTDLWVTSLEDPGATRNLTAHTDMTTGDQTLSDTDARPGFVPPLWSPDGNSLTVSFSRHGRTWLGQVRVADGTVNHLIGAEDTVGPLKADDARETMAYLRATATAPGDLWVQRRAGGIRRLTRINDGWLRSRAIGEPQEHWVDAPDGTRVQGWILKPIDFDPGRRYPAILEIHGGPQLQYGHAFFHEFHMLAGLGYVVCYCNPRGSQGYGNAHVDVIVDDFAAVTYSDLMAWTDHVAALPYVEETRIGVTGGSFGGYMTNWIVGHTTRFAVAVTQRSLCNLISFHGTSDFTWLFQCWFGDAPPWERMEDYWRQSPLKYVGNVKTPTLVMHAEGDKRVSIEQSEQWFTALKQLGVESEFVRIEAESHNLSRGGRTDRRIARLEHMAGWFERYLRA